MLNERGNYKGCLVYIIPNKYKEACSKCLSDKMPSTGKVTTGFIAWEDLIHIIGVKLIERINGYLAEINNSNIEIIKIVESIVK